MEAIRILERAGKHIVKTRHLENYITSSQCNVTQATKNHNPDIQALAVISLALAYVVGGTAAAAEWTRQVESHFGIIRPEGR